MSSAKGFAVVLCSLLLIATTSAQPAPPAPPPGAGPNFKGAGGVGFSGKNTKEQLAAIKDLLAAADDDWQTLSPKVERVLAAKQNLNTGAGMNWTSQNGFKPVVQASTSRPDTPAGKALQAVRDAVTDPAASDEDLSRKMAAVREARQKARIEYQTAQNELISATSPRQQAILMTLGVIE